VIAVSDLTESHVTLACMTDALFCSELETGSVPTGQQLTAAIREALRTRHGWNGCTRIVAGAFTKDPVAADERERWCRGLAEGALKAKDIRLADDCPE
jgi:hypothetical protein